MQRITGDRLLLDVVTGGSAKEQRAYGDLLAHDARYDRTAEFLDVVDKAFGGPGVNHEGAHFRVESSPRRARAPLGIVSASCAGRCSRTLPATDRRRHDPGGKYTPRFVPHAPSSKSCIATSATQSGSRESDTI
ncbi:LLM class flavin-dependent oxidoreductase [Sorangium sp. So ce341]|uniref:LLM class flavin-dependent oxidoreductase n=1 Tax=Sorangium sp. So ce341 TaxID=3133302 RepID=UPI003F5FBD98